MSGKEKKVFKDIRANCINTQQTESYRQQMAREERILVNQNKTDIEKHKERMAQNYNYLNLYNKDDPSRTHVFSGKKADTSTSEGFYKSLPFMGDTVNNFDQKIKKDRTYTMQKAKEGPLAKEIYVAPVTTAQEIGWREPIDNMNLGYGLKNSFPVMGVNMFRENKKPKEEAK